MRPSSALYVGTIRHRRGQPAHAFRHRLWQLLLDLDEIPALARQIPYFSHNRFNLLSFDDRDHMGPEPSPVRTKLERWLAARDVPPATGKVLLLSGVRQLGWGFNPVSFYFGHDSDGCLRWVVAEVNNTFGESYCYLLPAPARDDGSVVAADRDKLFHVSPFQPVAGRYRFRVTRPGSRLSIHIDVLRDGRRVFDATMAATRRPLTQRTLLQALLRHPHQTAATVGLIHLHAARLWLKRAPFHSKPAPPAGAWRTRHG